MAICPTVNGLYVMSFKPETIAYRAAAELFGTEKPSVENGAPFVFEKDNPDSVIWVVNLAGLNMWREKCIEIRKLLHDAIFKDENPNE